MKHNNIYLLTGVVVGLLFSGCSDDSAMMTGPVNGSQTEIRLQAEIDQANVSRADDNGFADGDRIGIYAVNYSSNGNPGSLAPEGNLADNVGYTYDEENYKWNGDRNIYFADDKTPADIYGYYPYMDEITDVNAYPFSIQRNQSAEFSNTGMSAYEASDFLWAKTAAATASTPLVTMTFKHILASVQVSLLEGKGFADGEWAKFDKNVIISNTNRNAVINLATGEAKITGEIDNIGIVANPQKDNYRAIVIPQTVDAGKSLIAITVGSQSYNFVKDVAMTYLPTKMHKFTIEVSKGSAGGDFEFKLIDESITAWESDLTSHNGTTKEYIVVHVPYDSSLGSQINSNGLVAKDIVNLKITGKLDNEDFKYIRKNMKVLEAINIKDAILPTEGYYGDGNEYLNISENSLGILPNEAFFNVKTLRRCVLPGKLAIIGSYAFAGTALEGSLEIPEGVVYIGANAYCNYYWNGSDGTEGGDSGTGHVGTWFKFTGKLTLPSTLKAIGGGAFSGCDFTGQLVIPENVVSIGSHAFRKCEFFTGELRLPDNLENIGEEAFSMMTGISGRLKMPKKLKTINGFGDMNVKSIDYPEAPTIIASNAFNGTALSGVLKVPESIVSISENAFASTDISGIILPKALDRIPMGMCMGCKNLVDTLILPEKVQTIGRHSFYGCNMLEAVVLPKSLTFIDEDAFRYCYSLNYIQSNAVEPPTLHESAFIGVAKDNFIVEVPEQSVDAYRNAPGWCEFKRISAYRNFVARPSKYNVLNKGGKKEIILNADAEWEMIECPSWCHVDKTSGSKKTTINLTVDQMSHGSDNRFGKIIFRLKGAQDYLTHIDVGQYDYKYDEDQYITLQSATKGNGFNLAFIGDGYDAADIASEEYIKDMEQEIEYFFAVEPYATYREYFNIYTAIALSEDSGVETVNTWRRTKFHTIVGDGCSRDGQRLTTDYESALNYCAENIPPTVNCSHPHVGCILLANSELYEGVTYMGESFCAVVTKSTENYPYDARGIVQHEAGGHGVGWLGDEYIYHNDYIQRCECVCCGHVAKLLADQSVGFSLNMSLNGKYKEVPWTHLIFNPKYGDIVDIYEGGYFHSCGVYRSEVNSCMNNNVPYFSTWSRQLIVQRIMKMAGEPFDLDSFYAKDSRAVGRDFTSTSRAGATNVTTPARHGNAPIRITNYKYGKKGAKR